MTSSHFTLRVEHAPPDRGTLSLAPTVAPAVVVARIVVVALVVVVARARARVTLGQKQTAQRWHL